MRSTAHLECDRQVEAMAHGSPHENVFTDEGHCVRLGRRGGNSEDVYGNLVCRIFPSPFVRRQTEHRKAVVQSLAS